MNHDLKPPTTAAESQAYLARFQKAYKDRYPDDSYGQMFEAFTRAVQSTWGVQPGLFGTTIGEGAVRTAGRQPDIVGTGTQALAQGLEQETGGIVPRGLTEAVLPSSLPEAGVMGTMLGMGALTSKLPGALASQLPKALTSSIPGTQLPSALSAGARGAILRPLVAGAGGVAAGVAGGQGLGESIRQAAPYTAALGGGEALRGVGLGAANIYRTTNPFAQGEKLTKAVAKGIEEDLQAPGLFSALPKPPGGGAGTALAVAPGGEMRKTLGTFIGDAEKTMRQAIGGGDRRLAMPSITTQASGVSPEAQLQLSPTFDEALAAVKLARSDARRMMKSAQRQDELLQARAAQNRADAIEKEFNAAVDSIVGEGGGTGLRQRLTTARTQFAKGLRVSDMLEDPSIYTQGPRGVTLDQQGLAAALLKDVKDFAPDQFPKTISAAARGGAPYASDVNFNIPLSVQAPQGGVRQYVGGIPLFQRRAGAQGMTAPGFVGQTAVGVAGGRTLAPEPLRTEAPMVE